jgi:hypothetical protein
VTEPPAFRRGLPGPAWAGRNYSALTAAAVVTNLGGDGALIAAAFAVPDAGGAGGPLGAGLRVYGLAVGLLRPGRGGHGGGAGRAQAAAEHQGGGGGHVECP